MRKRTRDYSQIKYDDIPEKVEPGSRKIINSNVIIDRGSFQKSSEEKKRLKLEKRRHKESMKGK
jgi:hypothetical protein